MESGDLIFRLVININYDYIKTGGKVKINKFYNIFCLKVIIILINILISIFKWTIMCLCVIRIIGGLSGDMYWEKVIYCSFFRFDNLFFSFDCSLCRSGRYMH